jgi:hypothetical protein
MKGALNTRLAQFNPTERLFSHPVIRVSKNRTPEGFSTIQIIKDFRI